MHCGPGYGSKEGLAQNSTPNRHDIVERRSVGILGPAKQRYQYTLSAGENLDQFAIYQDLSGPGRPWLLSIGRLAASERHKVCLYR